MSFREGVPFGPQTEGAKEALMEFDAKLTQEIEENGGLEGYMEKHPELAEAFTAEKPYLCCMDERTAKGTLHLGGSGILIEGADAQKAFQQRLKDAGVEGIYSHEGCGAVKLYAEQHQVDDLEEAAKLYAQGLADQLGIEYKGHLKTSGEHPGRAVYLDATGKLDSGSNVWQEKMPGGFTISRNLLTSEEARDAVVLAVKIALGVHGQGMKRFSEVDPLLLVAISEDAEASEALQAELADMIDEIVAELPDAKGKIRVDGF